MVKKEPYVLEFKDRSIRVIGPASLSDNWLIRNGVKNNKNSKNDLSKTGKDITPENQIFVSGIPKTTTNLQVKDFFALYGAVRKINIITDNDGYVSNN